MDLYSILREFADSWMLLFLTLFFVGVFVWVMRPGSTRQYKDTADIPFRHENKPAADDDTVARYEEVRS
ncbi:cytochrome c oxidase, cbb3-type subunit IV [Actibacterium atlanticum]|uniref:Cytochrome c oxidase, cbb3-type subunit IV n=1 Tax=Actibacterium atlanticum TaxID=1461693 RepID=A0A058ZI45_9RHOB|nr:CcoQ/FixQ family Cbb3-type cytochrome c oxidase assembly chaperone [Actibacterium atlanticum]KCV81213.1 cytochrome c oxidase, cbb3-type subunit IV [Actibacterium atlanticum]